MGGILILLGVMASIKLVKWVVRKYKNDSERLDRQREERIDELMGVKKSSESETSIQEIECKQDDIIMEEKHEKRDLMQFLVDTLINIGCQPKVTEDGRVGVYYQGDGFVFQPVFRNQLLWMN